MPERTIKRNKRGPPESRRSGIPHLTAILIGLFFVAQAGFMASLFRMTDLPPEPEAGEQESEAEAPVDSLQ